MKKGENCLEAFDFEEKRLMAVGLGPCFGCVFNSINGCSRPDEIAECISVYRKDGKSIRYIEV